MVAIAPRATHPHFADRHHAGRVLAHQVRHLTGNPDVVVLALPPGGVPVAWEVARAIGAPLDVFVVRNLAVPGHCELTMGAVASGGIRVLERDLLDRLGISAYTVNAVTREQTLELTRAEHVFRDGGRPLSLRNRVVLLVDDGLSSAATLRAAVLAVRTLKPKRVVVATPVAAASACDDVSALADEVICAEVPGAATVGVSAYADATDTTDREVRALLGLPSMT